MYESNDEMVSRPSHYRVEGAPEVIDIIEDFISDLTGVIASDTANIIKYSFRWHKKNGIQDIEKVLWYSVHLKEKVESNDIFEKRWRYINLDNVKNICTVYASQIKDKLISELAYTLMYDTLVWSDLADITTIINDAENLLNVLRRKENN